MIKWTCEVIWRHTCMHKMIFDSWIKWDKTSNHLIIMFILSKMSRNNVFQYVIPDRISYLRALDDNFENFWKIQFQWERIIKKPLAFCKFLLDFESENGFKLTKERRIEMRFFVGLEHIFVFPIVSLRFLFICDIKYCIFGT